MNQYRYLAANIC